jgi:LPS export ABC transporter permease LptF
LKTLHRYVTRQVLGSLLMTMFVFTFVLLLGNVLKAVLPLLVNRQATFGLFLEAVGLLIPFVWTFALPMAMLTATLLVFGRFSADQELTAMRASGISVVSLIMPVLLLSLLLCGVSAFVNLELAPRCRVAYKNLLFRVGAELSSAQLPEGRFIKEHPGYIFYVEKNRNQVLQNVIVIQLPQKSNATTTTIQSPRGQYRVDAANGQIILELFDARYVIMSAGEGFPGFTTNLTITLEPKLARPTRKRPGLGEMTFHELKAELRELEEEISAPLLARPESQGSREGAERDLKKQVGDLTSPVRVQLHRQLAFSFACFGFTLVGIPLGIRVHRRETNVGVAVALVLVLIYYSFLHLGQSLAARPEYAPHLIVWLPNFIFQAVGVVLLWRVDRGG